MHYRHTLMVLVALALAWLGGTNVALAQAPTPGSLRVGAAKVEITPAKSAWPAQYLGVLDPVYSRAIVVDNGLATTALITVDAIMISDAVWERLSGRIAAETGIPVKYQVITATGTHSVPGEMRNPASPSAAEEAWERRIIQSVVRAKARLQPATMSWGESVSHINVQRDRIDPATGDWWEGPDYAGVSDKSVSAMTFAAADGNPIAVYYNYGVFNVVTGTLDLISGDVTGASSKYLEDSIGGDFVAVLSAGAHGDQNPIFFNQTYELREIRIEDYAKRGEDIAIAMPPPGGVGLDRANPRVARLMEEQKQVNAALGLMLGEAVLHAMRTSRDTRASAAIHSDQTVVSCPGRRRTNQGRAGMAGTYVDDAPVPLRLGLTMIGDVAIGSVNGGVYAAIGLRLKEESPYAKTMMTTAANGFMGSYIPDDASYGHETFAVLNSRLKPGCAERAIVDGIIGMMPAVR